MIPEKFSYKKAGSVDEAIQMLSQNEDAKILAGGHSLIPAMKLRLSSTDLLIDIAKIPGLRYIKQDGNAIAIGAGTTHYDLETSDLLQSHLAMVPEAAGLIGDMQVRNAGTIGGSLAHADPAADWPGVVMAADGVIVVQGPNGQRTVSSTDFFQGFYSTALEDHEIITEIRLPMTSGAASTYQKFMQPASRFAIVGCAVMLSASGGTCSAASVAFNGVSDAPFRDSGVEQAIIGKALTAENIAAAAEHAANSVDIMSDHFAAEDYRQHLARVYARKALTEAASRL